MCIGGACSCGPRFCACVGVGGWSGTLKKKVIGAPILREDGSQDRQHVGLVVVRRRWHTPLAKRAEFVTFVTVVWKLTSTFIHFRSSKPITAALKANISEYVVGKHPPEPRRRQPGRALPDVPHRPPWCYSPLSHGGAQRLS